MLGQLRTAVRQRVPKALNEAIRWAQNSVNLDIPVVVPPPRNSDAMECDKLQTEIIRYSSRQLGH
jgi:hypothetical protein